MLRIELEPNAKHGEGYQARVISDGEHTDFAEMASDGSTQLREKVLDTMPYTLYEIIRAVDKLVARYDERTGTTHRLQDVLWITEDAVRANGQRDIASARLLKELREGTDRYIPLTVEDLERSRTSDEEGRLR